MRRPTYAASKFTVPESAAWIDRPDVVERLNTGKDARLTVVVGSPGSGKTSTLAQWSRAQPPGTVGWLRCDVADVDERRFWQALLAAVGQLRPGFAADAVDLLTLAEWVDHDALECVLAAAEDLAEPISLVIDDLQLTGGVVREQLRFAIGRGFGRIRLILASRVDPDLGLDRLRLSGQLCELRESDLRFGRTEAALLLEQVGVVLSDDELAVVLDRTEGWAAGLQLAAVALRDAGKEEFLARLDRSGQVIGQYLWSEVFQAQRAEVKRFLLDTCIVEELSGGLAAALSPRTAVTLDDIEEANLFLSRVDPAGSGFRYHSLFAEMLRYRLRSTEPEHELVLHQRAAAWYGSRGDMAAAFRHRWRSGQRTAAISAVHTGLMDDYFNDLLPTFEDPDRLLTDDDLTAVPSQAVSYAIALAMRGFVDDAARLAVRIEAAAGALLNPEARQQLRAARAVIALACGDTHASIQFATSVVERNELTTDDQEWLALAVLVGSRSYAWEGDLRAAAALHRSVRPKPSSRAIQLELAGSKSLCQLMSGALNAAYATSTQLEQELAASSSVSDDLGLLPVVVSATVLLERGRTADAERRLLAVTATDTDLRRPARVLVRLSLARLSRAIGDFDAAFAALDDADLIMGRHPVGSGVVDHLLTSRARLLIDSGGEREARTVIGAIAQPFLRSLLQLQLAVARGHFDTAATGLEKLAPTAYTRRQQLEAALVGLAIAVARDKPAEAAAAAAAVFSIAAPEGFVLPVAEAGSAVLAAVRRAAHTRPRSDHVDALMAVQPCVPAHLVVNGHHAHEKLSKQERVVLRYLDTSMGTREIADALFVSVNTIKTHLRNINRKLGAGSRAEAVVTARRLRYL